MEEGFSAYVNDFISGSVKRWWVTGDKTIAITGDLYIYDRFIRKFPIAISSVDGKFHIECPRLLTVVGITSQYKELVVKNCYFPNELYIKAIKGQIPLEDVVLENITAKQLLSKINESFDEERGLAILKEYFPKAYQEFRGRAVGKMFGF